jgi:hypothetical protein
MQNYKRHTLNKEDEVDNQMKVKLFESKEDKYITLLKKIQTHLKFHSVQCVYCHHMPSLLF